MASLIAALRSSTHSPNFFAGIFVKPSTARPAAAAASPTFSLTASSAARLEAAMTSAYSFSISVNHP
ncbi:hypothetical protein G6F60_015141 [Rhizopus arrhizus]|nr:hypothetical protein G6F60_015141 [Rhizopus arrhizus]